MARNEAVGKDVVQLWRVNRVLCGRRKALREWFRSPNGQIQKKRRYQCETSEGCSVRANGKYVIVSRHCLFPHPLQPTTEMTCRVMHRNWTKRPLLSTVLLVSVGKSSPSLRSVRCGQRQSSTFERVVRHLYRTREFATSHTSW